MKKITTNLIKIFGFIYCFLNCVAFVVFFSLILMTGLKSKEVSGAGMLLPPLLGIFAGYWITRRKFGVWRVTLIVISIIISVGVLISVFYIFPKISHFGNGD